MTDVLDFMERDSLTIWGDDISAQKRSYKDVGDVLIIHGYDLSRMDRDGDLSPEDIVIRGKDIDKLRELLNEMDKRKQEEYEANK